MNLLRQCTFLDRYRNAYVELDDIIEENFNSLDNNNNNNNDKNNDNGNNNQLNLMLYFTANWLSETNASSKELNKKLTNLCLNKKINNCNYFEIVFISSDKTKDSYDQFIDRNKFIRYSLQFQDQEIKVCFLIIFFLIF
jgi:hypothetical protein